MTILEKAFIGGRRYWGWIAFLVAIIAVAGVLYLWQLSYGLAITGMSRDVTWGFYIAQMTFLVGVAASAVMVVGPYYLHHYKTFGRITILGEFLAVAAVTMCVLFVVVDLGQPSRALNVILYFNPSSIMFYDFLVLSGYLLLNLVIGWFVLSAEAKSTTPPSWVRPLIYLSIPWAISIHTVTAFLYAGLPGRELWLTAIMAPRFLASAFASGPSLLIILALIVRRFTRFDPGVQAIQKLASIVTYAMLANLFFVAMEFFTAFYSQIPGHMNGLSYLFFGLEGHSRLTPWMWTSMGLAVVALALLGVPATRKNEGIVGMAAAAIFIAAWIDKGIGLVVGGFIPNPLDEITEYSPTAPEVGITLGVYALGFLILTVLYRIATAVKEEVEVGSRSQLERIGG